MFVWGGLTIFERPSGAILGVEMAFCLGAAIYANVLDYSNLVIIEVFGRCENCWVAIWAGCR
jgi:hypothetical protein